MEGVEKKGAATEAPPKFKRSFWRPAYLKLELRFTLFVAWLVIITLLCGVLATYLIVWAKVLALPYMAAPEDLLMLHQQILKSMAVTYLLMGLLVMIVAAILQYRIIHRVSGPIYRLEKAMRELAAGQLPAHRLTFRPKDLFAGLGSAFNDLVDAIRSKREFR